MSLSATTRNTCCICSCGIVPLASGFRSGGELAEELDGASIAEEAGLSWPMAKHQGSSKNRAINNIFINAPTANDQRPTTILPPVFQRLPQAFRLEQSLVHAVQLLLHRRGE